MYGYRAPGRLFGACLLAAMMILCALPSDGRADPGLTPASKFVNRIANATLKVAHGPDTRRSAGFRKLLARHGDIGPVALFALGPYAKSLPKSRRSEYYKLVVDFTAGVFKHYAREFQGATVEVKGETERRGKFVVVDTRVTYPDGRPSRQLRWRVAARNGRYKVSDVSVAGFWLTLQLRTEFVSFLRKHKGDFDALFAALRRSAR